MFRNNKKGFNKEHIQVYLDNGGLGDYIALMPAVKYIQDHVPNIIQHLWCPDFFVPVAKNLLPNLIVKPFSEQKDWKTNWGTVKLSNQAHSPLRTHLTDYAFNVLVDKQVDIQYKNYLPFDLTKIDIDAFNLPEKYVVITTGFTAEVREMLPEFVNDTALYVRTSGYIPIFLGSHVATVGVGQDIKGTFSTQIDYSIGLDLINKTSLLEAAKIIAGAKAIVGLDNGLMHVAGGTNTPIIGGYSTVDPKLRVPYRKDILGWNCYTVVPSEDLACRFCQSEFIHVYNHDFRQCYYSDKQCLSQMTSEQYINHLVKLLD